MEELYATIAREGSTKSMLPRMQTRAELYAHLDYHARGAGRQHREDDRAPFHPER